MGAKIYVFKLFALLLLLLLLVSAPLAWPALKRKTRKKENITYRVRHLASQLGGARRWVVDICVLRAVPITIVIKIDVFQLPIIWGGPVPVDVPSQAPCYKSGIFG